RFFLSFHKIQLRPYVTCDFRGSNTLLQYRSNRHITSKYYLMDFTQVDDRSFKDNPIRYNIYTNDTAPSFKQKTFFSTSKKFNVKFLIQKYLTDFFVNQNFIPRNVSNKYFARLTSLLVTQYHAIRSRLTSVRNNNKSTK